MPGAIERAMGDLASIHPGQAGFLPVADGIDALAVRLSLAERAEHSIDAQYYEIEDDLAGCLFIEALLRAADRGVHVRLLLDDYRTKGFDAGLAALREHSNFELRIYNPYLRRTARIIEGLLSFTRINRRMHNKSFTVDNRITVIGGRNIGDQYFSVGHQVNFADLDVIGIGPIASDVAKMFEDYWTSPAAIRVDVVAKGLGIAKVPLSKVLERISRSKTDIATTKYAAAVESAILDQLRRNFADFVWATYRLVYDRPEKTQAKKAKGTALIRHLLVEAFDKAQEEVILVSPYFVPRLTGVRRFRELCDRGVDVTVVTNSLASNNQIYAHGGYAAVRKPLLRMGVRLFELRADAQVVGAKHEHGDDTKATLHTKAFSIDREQLFIGSFNFDPRSANINTEMGVFINSAELAGAFSEGAIRHTPRYAYEVRLGKVGTLQWHRKDDNHETVASSEPQTCFWRRAAGRLARLLPIRGQV